uniref:Uncharacterized protein n=1 Tax=Arundo donax TaxID=35708 RepID=A0A0A9CQF9_ARUDO
MGEIMYIHKEHDGVQSVFYNITSSYPPATYLVKKGQDNVVLWSM